MPTFLAGLLMALSVADGTITLSTGAIGTTFTVSGLSFQPKAIMLFWSGRATNGQAEDDHKFGVGFAVSTSSRRAVSTQSDYTPTTMATDKMRSDNCCVLTQTITGAIDGKADLDAILSDGFRLIIDDVFSAGLQVGWIAWGGDDITDVAIVDFATRTTNGTQDINAGFALDTGLDDKVVLIAGATDQAVDTNSGFSFFGFGAAAGNSIVNCSLGGNSVDAIGTSQTNSYCRNGDCIGLTHSDIIAVRAAVTVWLSTGFRLNYTTTDGTAWNMCALVIKGGRWQVGDAVTSTGTSNQTEATSYVPKGLVVVSHNNTASTAGTAQAHDQRSIGVATSASSRRYASIIDKDAAGTADIGVAYNETQMYANQSTAATIAIEGLMDLVSFDATPGFTYVMDDADPAAAFFFYVLAADAPVPPAAPPFGRRCPNAFMHVMEV